MLVDGNVGAIVELNCETDFVAKGDVVQRRRSLRSRRSSLEQGDARPRRAAARRRDGRRLREGPRRQRWARTSSSAASSASRPPTASLDGYKHMQNERGIVGVLVELGGVDPSRRRPRGRARHRAAHRESPRRATSRATTCPPTSSSASATIYETQTRNEGKPEQAWPKIVEGKLNGFYKDRRARSSSRSSRTRSRRSAALVRGLGERCRGPSFRPRQDRRGVATDPSEHEERLMSESKYRRVVLKLSGEAFADQRLGFGHRRRRRPAHRRRGHEGPRRPRRRDRDRRRRRQHLPRHDAAHERAWTAPRRLHGHARRP